MTVASYLVGKVVMKSKSNIKIQVRTMPSSSCMDFYTLSSLQIFERNCKLTVRENVPTTFHKPKGLFVYEGDQMSQEWSVV